jgi:Fe-S cluster assembly ATP-binding protein
MNLIVDNISVSAWEKEIIDWFSYVFEQWKNYCLLGKNGSWKSSLLMSIMWHPNYLVTHWNIRLWEINITELEPHERAKLWLFCAFQNIPEIPWVKLFEFLRHCYNARFEAKETFMSFKKIIDPLVQQIWIDRDFLFRDLNVGFSGWEKRKVEVLQLALLKPTWIMIDEIDSWLDVDAFRSIANYLKSIDNLTMSFIIVTHYFTILDYLPINHVIVMKNGQIVKEWDTSLVELIKENWFENLS